MSPAVKLFVVLVGVLLFIDLVFLNVVIVGQRQERLGERLATVEEQVTPLLGEDGASKAVTGAPLRSASQSFEGQATGGDEAEESETVATPQPSPTPLSVQNSGVTKEVFIPLGSASTFSTEWVDTGAQVYIDTTIYSEIRAAYFQASLRSNSGVVSARLKQMNEKVAVPGSEISHAGGNATFVGSGEILLSAGNKLYAVQLRSQTGQEVFLENARVRLVLR